MAAIRRLYKVWFSFFFTNISYSFSLDSCIVATELFAFFKSFINKVFTERREGI